MPSQRASPLRNPQDAAGFVSYFHAPLKRYGEVISCPPRVQVTFDESFPRKSWPVVRDPIRNYQNKAI